MKMDMNLEEVKRRYEGRYFKVKPESDARDVYIPSRRQFVYINEIGAFYRELKVLESLDGRCSVRRNMLSVSDGVGIMWKGGVGSAESTITFMTAYMLGVDDLEETTEDEFLEIKNLVMGGVDALNSINAKAASVIESGNNELVNRE